MGGRIQAAAQERVQKIPLPRLEEVQELGRRLLYIAALDEVKVLGKPLWADDPRLLVAKLEATVDGCRWLLARWAEFRHLLDGRTHWELPVFSGSSGSRANSLTRRSSTRRSMRSSWPGTSSFPSSPSHYWEEFRRTDRRPNTACFYALRWREIAPRPSDQAEAWKTLYAIVEQHILRLEALLERNKDMEAEEASDWDDRAALDLSPEFERHRRYICRPRHESCIKHWKRCGRCRESGKREWQMPDDRWQMSDARWQMADARWQMADARWQRADARWQSTDARWQSADARCQRADARWQSADGRWQSTDARWQGSDVRWQGADARWQRRDARWQRRVGGRLGADRGRSMLDGGSGRTDDE